MVLPLSSKNQTTDPEKYNDQRNKEERHPKDENGVENERKEIENVSFCKF